MNEMLLEATTFLEWIVFDIGGMTTRRNMSRGWNSCELIYLKYCVWYIGGLIDNYHCLKLHFSKYILFFQGQYKIREGFINWVYNNIKPIIT